MKHFTYTLAVAGMVSSLGFAALAQSDVDAATTTCADFTAMSAEDQRAALDTLNSADAGATMDSATSTDGTDAGADMSAGADATSSMTGDTASETGDAASSADASTDPEVQAVIAACAGNDDALVADQMP